MNWFDKIQARQNFPDNSPQLKKGEIKQILISSFNQVIPEFTFHGYKNGTYYFQRVRKFKDYPVLEVLYVIFGLKDKNFACSVGACINKTYFYSKTYRIGKIDPHIDLIVLKTGTGVHSIEDAYYFHNGRINNTTKVVNEIANDFKIYGLPFLDKNYNNLFTDKLLNKGFEYIAQLKLDKTLLKKELELERGKADWYVSRIQHPIFLDLKEKLESVPNQKEEDRGSIPGLTYELIELYCDTPVE